MPNIQARKFPIIAVIVLGAFLASCSALFVVYELWLPGAIVSDWKSRLQPFVDSKATLSEIERAAKRNHWEYEVELPTKGDKLGTKSISFTEKRTVTQFLYGPASFDPWIDLDERDRAQAVTVQVMFAAM